MRKEKGEEDQEEERGEDNGEYGQKKHKEGMGWNQGRKYTQQFIPVRHPCPQKKRIKF